MDDDPHRSAAEPAEPAVVGVHVGDEVFAADGEAFGVVLGLHPEVGRPAYVVVERGLFTQAEFYVPAGAVALAEGGRVYLSVSRREIADLGWDATPVVDAAPAGATGQARDTTGMASRLGRVLRLGGRLRP